MTIRHSALTWTASVEEFEGRGEGMTIVEALEAAMRDVGAPLSAKEAYGAIVAKSLYVFRAKDPQQIVLQQLRRHCLGIDAPSASPIKRFQRQGTDKFFPLPSPVTVAVHRRAAK
jgi:restriction system protein